MTLQAGFEPLLKAISDGDLPALDRLFASGHYSVNSEIRYYSEDDKHYYITPLYWAVKVNQREVCRYLLRMGADPFNHMVYEYYPLHEACSRGSSGIVQEFIEAECRLDQPNCDGDTPLHIACLRGHIDCIQLLLSAGADRTVRNTKKQTPLEVAQYNNQTDLYKLFEVFDRETSPTKWLRSKPRQVIHRPIPGQLRRNASNPRFPKGRPHSFVSSTRPSHFYSNGSQDDTLIHDTNTRQLRTDITRTYSFSENRNHSPPVNDGELGRSYCDSPLLRKHQPVSIQRKQCSSSQKPRPSLNYMSHDSQLVLPTQELIIDPRRTQTCHDFGNALPCDRRRSLSPEAIDEVEMDTVRTRPAGLGSRLRIGHLVQCWDEAVRNTGVSDISDSSPLETGILRILFSIHNDMGFSDEEYASIQRLNTENCTSSNEIPSRELHSEGIEFVWGCDYELINLQPLSVSKGCPTSDSAEMIFHVKLKSDQQKNEKNALLKVTVRLFNLEEKNDFESFHSGNHRNSTHEGNIIAALPEHLNIVNLLHHCSAYSRPFERFTRLFCPEDGHLSLKMASQCSLLFLRYTPFNLERYFSNKQQVHSRSPFGFSENNILTLLVQLLLAMTHLDKHGIILGHMTSSNIFLEDDLLLLADFSYSFDAMKSDLADIKTWLQSVPSETLLEFPPELRQFKTSSSCEVTSSFQQILQKCNVFVAGRLFHDLLTSESLTNSSSVDQSADLVSFSAPFKFLMKKLISDKPDERFSSLECVLYCMILLFGPNNEDCKTKLDCQQWLMTETFHLFLQPSLKGHPSIYNKDIHTKLLYIYLSLATPEKIWSIAQQVHSEV